MDKLKSVSVLLFFILICLCAGLAGSNATLPSIPTWYHDLVKPPLNPPQSIFGPVWTTLYLMMAVAAWLVWRQIGFGSKPIALFFVQLALNTLWSFLFFAWRRPDLAFVDIVLLWIFILLTLISFWRVRKGAGAMLIPYLLWVSFAGYLNAGLWYLNS